MAISDIRTFEIYTAMSLHFKEDSKYDFIKYGGKTRVSEQSFKVRKDRYFFDKVAQAVYNEAECIELFAINFMRNPKTYIRNVSWDLYRDEWQTYKEALYFRFKKEAEKMYALADKPFLTEEGEPVLLHMVLSKDISLEFLIMVNYISQNKIFDRYDEKCKDNFIWTNEYKPKIEKYAPFIVNYWKLDTHKDKLLDILKASK